MIGPKRRSPSTVETNEHPITIEPPASTAPSGSLYNVWWIVEVLRCCWHFIVAVFFGTTRRRTAAKEAGGTTQGCHHDGDGHEGQHRAILIRSVPSLRFLPIPLSAEVTGWSLRCTLRRANWKEKGDPPVEIDSRPYRANLLQAQGALGARPDALAQAQMDLNVIAMPGCNANQKQLLDDQVKIVSEGPGHR